MYYKLRRLILEKAFLSKTGHIGSNLSVCDIIWCLYDSVLNVEPEDFKPVKNNERNRFILSKGHASLAFYVVLFLKNFITKEDLDTYCDHNGTFLGVHPKNSVLGIEFSTGSLGQGITFAVGEALAAKIQNSNRKIYCLISDGEINEGSCWEAFMFASHNKLDNLVILYDNNNLQALGKAEEVLLNSNIEEKMKSFGFSVLDIKNGHSHSEIKQVLTKIHTYNIKQPVFVNVKTILSKGISFMENKLEWHYKSMNEEVYNLALKEINL